MGKESIGTNYHLVLSSKAAILDFKMADLHYMSALRFTFDTMSKIMSNVDSEAAVDM